MSANTNARNKCRVSACSRTDKCKLCEPRCMESTNNCLEFDQPCTAAVAMANLIRSLWSSGLSKCSAKSRCILENAGPYTSDTLAKCGIITPRDVITSCHQDQSIDGQCTEPRNRDIPPPRHITPGHVPLSGNSSSL